MRKPSLNTLVNVAILAAALAIGANHVRQFFSPVGTGSALSASPRYAQGDEAPQVTGLDYGKSDRTFLIVVNSSCRFCTASMPFYTRLAGAADEGTNVVALSRETHDALRTYVGSHGFEPKESFSIAALSDARLNVTPTLLAVSRDGTIEQSWVGQLTSDDEAVVIALAESPRQARR